MACSYRGLEVQDQRAVSHESVRQSRAPVNEEPPPVITAPIAPLRSPRFLHEGPMPNTAVFGIEFFTHKVWKLYLNHCIAERFIYIYVGLEVYLT